MNPNIATLLKPPMEQLINEIHAVNHAWKVALDFGDIPQLAKSLQEMKTRLQVRLLHLYAPDRVYLALDQETESDETLYGLRLKKTDRRTNRCRPFARESGGKCTPPRTYRTLYKSATLG